MDELPLSVGTDDRRCNAIPIRIDPDDVVNNALAILGSFGYTSRAWRDVVTLLNSGQFRPGILVTHRFPLAGWPEAIASLRGAPSPRGKVLLEVG